MARMRVISIGQWGEGGIQVNFQMIPTPSGGRYEVSHTEMALPDNAREFARLMSVNLYDEFDVDAEKVTPDDREMIMESKDL